MNYLSLSKNYDIKFVKYLCNCIQEFTKDNINSLKCKSLNDEFNIDTKDIVLFAMSNLEISSTPDIYLIRINRNIKYKNMNLGKLINLITYGNRSAKGYNIIEDMFEFTKKSLPYIYKGWLKKNGN